MHWYTVIPFPVDSHSPKTHCRTGERMNPQSAVKTSPALSDFYNLVHTKRHETAHQASDQQHACQSGEKS